MFAPNHTVLAALENTGIEVILGTKNEDLPNLGSSDISYALSWIISNIIPYSDTILFRCISAGNEVIPGSLSIYVFKAITNLNTVLISSNLSQIVVTTSVPTSVLGISYPPSKGEFSTEVMATMKSIVNFLADNKYPLLVNVYPYFSYVNNQQEISLPYAIFNSSEVVVRDGKFEYKNLFDATIDAVYWALEKVGGGNVQIVVSESGWPSKGDGGSAVISHAEMYNGKMIEHVRGDLGTPKRPGKSIETYVFAIFNENLKPSGIEQNFGLFYPNMSEVYHVEFSRHLI